MNAHNGENVLEMQAIDKHFPGVHALDKVDFDLRRGEVHVLVGENGAGKSTLIKILSGAYTADSGDIFMHGKKVDIRDPHHAQQLGISAVYQELNLLPGLSVAENIFLGRQPLTNGLIDWPRMYQQAAALLAELGVDIAPRSTVRGLGVAEQQLVEIAKALSLEADIIIMDEPTASLTDWEIEELFRTIHTLKARGVSIIYISHRLEEVAQIGDRITVLRDGQKMGTVNVADTDVDSLIRMMIGRELKEKFPKETVDIGEVVLRVESLNRAGALHNINLTLRRGEILGIAGLVGAGRTELARIIFGADQADAGHIYVNSLEVVISSPNEAIRHGIGFLTEDRKTQGLILDMILTHNVTLAGLESMFPGTPLLDPNLERQATARYVDDLRVMTPSLERKAKFLSGGNQQKAVIAKWLCSQSRILIFDEPTRGIDVGAKVEVYQLMNALVKQGASIIMISSEMPEILGMSDRVLVMREGRIAGELSRQEASEEKIIGLAMGGINHGA